MKKLFRILLALMLFISCSDSNREENLSTNGKLSGIGKITFTDYAPMASKPIDLYYYIPSNCSATTPILMVLHGADRNALDYRNGWEAYAEKAGWIVIAPEFSEKYFPGGDGYNLGNIFADGDNPSAANLNPENQWLFSVLDPIFQFVKNKSGSQVETYNLYGHSAGAQVVQKFLMLPSSQHVNKAIAASAGWYTDPVKDIKFPYGLAQSPFANLDLSLFFKKDFKIMVGGNDTDPNSSSLRHNSIVDLQGLNRKDRAIHYYTLSKMISSTKNQPFNWSLEIVPSAEHDFKQSLANAAHWILVN